MDAVLEGTGVTPDQLRPDAFIPYAAFLAILDNACRADRPRRHRDAARPAPDAGGAWPPRQRRCATRPRWGRPSPTFVAFQINNSTGGAVYLIRADQDVILGYGVYDQSVNASPQIYDMVLAVGCNLIAELTQGAVSPAEIFCHGKFPAIRPAISASAAARSASAKARRACC